jgi:para-nitrobenzyl esterase
MHIKTFILMLAVGLTASAQDKNMNNHSLTIATRNGQLEGQSENEKVNSFKGIPYAQPPVGNLRWKAPMPVKNWEGIKTAKQFGPRAMQTNIFGDMVFRASGTAEDCLYLNVWTPAKKSKKLLPVLVYYYGGGFVAGDGSEPRYDGTSMAEKGIVAVTVNYRLGVFGFLAHPELSLESGYKGSGNYGLMDQALALQWVHDNISAFGGDPQKITIAGESAGSVSVSALMASPLSKNLIAGAIGESGSIMGALPALPVSEVEKNGKAFETAIGASSLEDMRKMSADSILSKTMKFGAFRFNRSVDGYFFPKDPAAIFASGEQAMVPLLLGWNSEESGARAVMGNDKMTVELFKKNVNKLYGKDAAAILAVYAPQTDEDVEPAARALAGDRFISYSTWKWADMHLRTGKPVYRYHYERPRPGNNAGAVHSAEIEYAMGNLSTNTVFAWTPDDYAVSKIMQSYFVRFIQTGNPNSKGLPKWTPLSADKPKVMRIDVNTHEEISAVEDRYKTLDKLVQKN